MASSRFFRALPMVEPDHVCVRVVDFSLAACLLVAPLWFGGRHDFGRFLYTAFVASATLAWATRCLLLGQPAILRTKSYALLLLAVGGVAIQLVPFSPELLNTLSPGISSLLPSWSGTEDAAIQLGQWQTLSLTPSATRIGLAVLICHALLFVITAERLQETRDIYRLLQVVGVAAAAMACFGLLQWLTSNGKLMWFYAHPQREIGAEVQGSFANKNHFSHFVVLGLGPLLLCLPSPSKKSSRSKRSKPAKQTAQFRRGVCYGAIVVCVAAIVLSLSRGGLLVMGVAASAGGLVLLLYRQLSQRGVWCVAAVSAACLFVISLGPVYQMVDRYSGLLADSGERLLVDSGRQEIWNANLAAAKVNPWFGYGVGSHVEVYRAFIEKAFRREFTHAESGYLHTLTECGIAGVLVMLLAALLVGSWCVRGFRAETDATRQRVRAAVVAGLAASFFHAAFDFAWYIPACMSITVVLAACAMRLSQTAVASEAEEPRLSLGWAPQGLAVIAGVCALAILWGPSRASFHWDRYLTLSGHERELQARLLTQSSPASENDHQHVAMLQMEMLNSLQRVIKYYPDHARAHLRLSARLLQQFDAEQRQTENAMGLMQVSEAALAANFSSASATMEWLERAFGGRSHKLLQAYRHAADALSLSPLQADGYAYLTNLTFLAPPKQRNIEALMEQGLRISPHDGGLLFEAGKRCFLEGRHERAIEHWKNAHSSTGSHRMQIAALLTPLVSAEYYLSEFSPDVPTLGSIYNLYAQKENEADLLAIARFCEAEASHTETQQAANNRDIFWRWLIASRAYRDLGDNQRRLDCVSRAQQLDPTDYMGRWELAVALADVERLDEAAVHARWCLARRPGDWQMKLTLRQHRDQRYADSWSAKKSFTK